MKLTLYNTLTRTKEPFVPLKKGSVGLYTCGPTVYNYAHIGNLRTYIFEDLLRRVLEADGLTVQHVMNITDVEDKIIRDAAQAGVAITAFTKPYEQAFLEDIEKLGIRKAWKYPRATDHIPAMIDLITSLLEKKHAYEADGSIYFDITSFKPYGRLSRLTKHTLKAGARVDADEYTKHDVQDFVLWKAAKEGEPSWNAPFGNGRPGWHIECSAMAIQYLGNTIDIHAGGVDLIFPHHENEIAQAEAATGEPFVRVFAEGEHLLVNGEKMAKSLGNTYTLRDIEERGFSPLDFRYLMLTAHYRTKLNFTWESLEASRSARLRLVNFYGWLQGEWDISPMKEIDCVPYKKTFAEAVNDDLNIPNALSILWNIVHDYWRSGAHNHKDVLETLHEFDEILGLCLKDSQQEIPKNIIALQQERDDARKEKNWEKADRLRLQLNEMQWDVMDTNNGSHIYPTFGS